MTSNLIWILYRSDSNSANKEALNCQKIIEVYGKKVFISEISIETNNIKDKKSLNDKKIPLLSEK